MRKVFQVLFGILCLTVVGYSFSYATDKTITLKLNDPWPATHHLAKNGFEPWVKMVEERTNGRLEIKVYYGGSLSKAREVWDGTVGGMWDYGTWIPTYKYNKFIGTLINELPFLFPDNLIATKVVQSLIKNYTKDEFKEVKLAAAFATDLYALWSTKKITKMEDFKGMKIRVAGRGWKNVISKWGATAVSLGPGDMYMALERGTVDAVIYSVTGGYGWKLQEVCPHVVKLDAQLVVGTLILNKKSWNKLPDDIQKLLENELYPVLVDLVGKTYFNYSQRIWSEFKDKGKMIDLSDDMKEKLRSTAQPVWDDWVTKAEAKGYPAKKMMADLKKMLKEYSTSH